MNRRAWLIPALLLALAGASEAASPERRLGKLMGKGQWLAAGELAREILAQSPENAKAKKLFEELEQRVRRDADNLDFDPQKYFYAQAYLDYFRGRFADAVDDMEQVLTFELENEEVLRFMDKAQARISEEAKGILARLPGLLEAGKYEEASELAQRAAKIDPGNAEAREWPRKVQQAQVSGLLEQVSRLYEAGKSEEASELCQRALELDPASPQAKEWAKRIQGGQAAGILKGLSELFEAGRYQEALDLAFQVLELDPGNAQAKDWIRRMQLAMQTRPAPPRPEAVPQEEARPAPPSEAPPGEAAPSGEEKPPEEPEARVAAVAPGLRPPDLPEQAVPAREAGPQGLPAPQAAAGEAAPAKPEPPKLLAKIPRARPKPPAPPPPPTPEWVESRYREALKAYVHRDLAKSRDLLRELLARDPDNDRAKKALQRIEKEL